MNMQERMAAASKRLAAIKAAADVAPKREPVAVPEVVAKPAKPRIRVYMGGALTAWMIEQAITGLSIVERWAESKLHDHKNGGSCPHCGGTGRYRFHTNPHRNEKCYRCNGKGRLDTRDLVFFARRLQGGGPVNWVISAPAA